MKTWILPLCLLAAACSSTRRLQFVPNPHEVALQPEENGPVLARVFTTVVGAEQRGETDDWSLHLRMRVENEDELAIRIEPGSAHLLDSNLNDFGEVEAAPPLGDELVPGSVTIYELFFQLPEVEPRLSRIESVHMRYRVAHDGGHADVSAAFSRLDEPNISTGLRFGFGYTNYGCW